jgi:hypothetical protein
MRTVAVLLALGGAGLCATPAAAQRTREQVRGDAASAARAGQISRGEVTPEPATPSVRTRPEVKAETRAAVKAGAIDHGEVTAAPASAASDAASKSRAEVRAEAASALHLRKPATPAEATRK